MVAREVDDPVEKVVIAERRICNAQSRWITRNYLASHLMYMKMNENFLSTMSNVL